jgi:acyl-CoA synthetase (AMP-forming)/AMP-acid ligase II
MNSDPQPRRIHELLDRHARERPDAPFLAQDGRGWSYREIAAEVDRFAALLSDAGVVGGDRVLIVSENSTSTIVAMLATQRLDAWPALANARLPSAELARLKQRIEPRIVLYDAGSSDAAREQADTANALHFAGVTGRAVHASAVDREPEPEPVATDRTAQPALLIFTSGTTGVPKAVMHSHASLISMGRALAEARRTGPDDVYSGAAPLAHVLGTATLMNVLAAGASLAIQRRLSVPELAASIAAGQTTHMSFVPVVYAQLCDHIRAGGIDLSGHRVTYMSAGGAPLVQSLKDRVEDLFGVALANGYGMTECAPGTRSVARIGGDAADIGFPEPGTEAAILDAGKPVADGEVGELMLRGRGMMMGYYRDPIATAAALVTGGWLATGDLARRGGDGTIFIVGRAKEMIIRNGFNVYPVEVENVIAAVPGLIQVAVIGLPLPDGNEEVVAVCQAGTGANLSSSAIAEAIEPKLAAYKRPSRIIVRDALPLGTTGKILKRQLIAELSGDERSDHRL